jgi:hypothetical protein
VQKLLILRGSLIEGSGEKNQMKLNRRPPKQRETHAFPGVRQWGKFGIENFAIRHEL